MKTLLDKALENHRAFLQNPYDGDCIFVGLSQANSHLIMMYWMNGYDPVSKERFIRPYRGNNIEVIRSWAEVDPMDTGLDLSYLAMIEHPECHIIGNDIHTQNLNLNVPLDQAISQWFDQYGNNDYPPLITAKVSLENELLIEFHFMGFSFNDSLEMSYHSFRREDFQDGVGYCITACRDKNSPRHVMYNGPTLLPLYGSNYIEATTNISRSLSEKSRVGIVSKAINLKTGKSSDSFITNYKLRI